MKISAFSLIELMVVIAIVAILAAIAVPAYKVYMLNSKLETIFPVIENLKQQIIAYHNQHGEFPNPAQLGFTTNSPTDNEVLNPGALNPYISYLSFGNYNNCSTEIYLYALNTLGQSDYNFAEIMFDIKNRDGVMYTHCYYGYGHTNGVTLSNSATDNLSLGICINENTTDAWDNNNYVHWSNDCNYNN